MFVRLYRSHPVAGLVVGLVLIVGLQVALAQEAQPPAEQPAAGQPAAEQPAAAPADTAEPADQEASGTMWDMVTQMDWTGWAFMGVLLAFSVFGTMVAIERLVNLSRNRIMPKDFCRGLDELVRRQEDDPLAFRNLCERTESPMSDVLRSALIRVGRPLVEVEKALEDAAVREISALRGRNRPLAVVGSVAPLVGLLGTVFGMILAFHSASQAGLGKAEVLAEGIYLALLTTAAGLTIAIPALLVVAYLNARVERYMREMDEVLMEAMPCFARMEQTTAPAPAAKPRQPEPAVATAQGS